MPANAKKRSSAGSPRKRTSQKRRKVPVIELHEQTLERQINLVTAGNYGVNLLLTKLVKIFLWCGLGTQNNHISPVGLVPQI